MEYFNEKKIDDLINNGNWELVPSDGQYYLRQRDKHYMKTIKFDLDDSVAAKYLKP